MHLDALRCAAIAAEIKSQLLVIDEGSSTAGTGAAHKKPFATSFFRPLIF